MHKPSVLLVAFLLAACGNGEGSLLGGDPTGRWRQVPNLADDDPPDPVEERHLLELAADGTFIERDGTADEPAFGTWRTEGGQLVLTEDGETGTFSLPYRASGNTFVMGALTPTGSTDGLVGTWSATTDQSGELIIVTMDLRADMTMTIEYDRETMPDESYTGTWTAVGNDARLTFMPEENFTITTQVTLVEGVLGNPYERLP
jgi:hypothetical protein